MVEGEAGEEGCKEGCQEEVTGPREGCASLARSNAVSSLALVVLDAGSMIPRVTALAMLALASLVACSSDDSSSPSGVDSGGASGPDGAVASDAGETGIDASTSTGIDGGRGSQADSGVSVSPDAGAKPGTLLDASACTYPDGGGAINKVKYVFVIAMENHDSGEIIGDVADAPYINGTLLPCYASSSNFNDPLPLAIPSEPHYVWMEAGTNTFADATFTTDNDPSAVNSTASTLHFSTQLDAASVTWRSYQQGLDPNATGACPIYSSGDFAAKHDPFVFFQDVSGNPPADDAAKCTSHHKALTALSGDLTAATVARYNFITPDLCHDMHGAGDCPNGNTVQAGDQFLQATLPALVSFAFANDGVIYVVWDEGDKGLQIPFLAIGPGVKRGYVGGVAYTHSSLVATNERVFGVSRLATVSSATDLADLFQAGALP